MPRLSSLLPSLCILPSISIIFHSSFAVEDTLKTLMNHRCCREKLVDETMRSQCNIDETLKISMQTIKITEDYNVLFPETSMTIEQVQDQSSMSSEKSPKRRIFQKNGFNPETNRRMHFALKKNFFPDTLKQPSNPGEHMG